MELKTGQLKFGATT